MKTISNGMSGFLFLPFLLLTLPVAMKAQFAFTTNDGAITITRYTGSGGTIAIPSTTNGLPVTSIAAGAFGISNGGGLVSKSSVTIPYSITNIASEEFALCLGLTAITVDTNNPAYSSVAGVLFDKSQTTLLQYPGGIGGSYTIPFGVTSIGSEAFYYCLGLTNVIIPDSVICVEAYAFCKCGSLASVALGSGISNIGPDAFGSCSNLSSLTVPNSVTNIGYGAFVECTGLTNVTLGNGITSIASEVFEDCGSLASIAVPNSVTSIENGAFFRCTSLTNVTIPNNVNSISDLAFSGCERLANVVIPNSVNYIGSGAFAGCPNLRSIYFEGNAPNVGQDTYSFVNGIVYYLPGTIGWDVTFEGLPTVLWIPQVQTSDGGFGVETNGFGFNINWASGQTVVVEVCTNFSNPVWQPLQTNTLTGGSSYFSDPQWTNYPDRFYRLKSQ
jgi:hypothetical protein